MARWLPEPNLLLEQAFRSGENYTAHRRAVRSQRELAAPPVECHVDFGYQPVRNREGEVDKILMEDSDVTARVAAPITPMPLQSSD